MTTMLVTREPLPAGGDYARRAIRATDNLAKGGQWRVIIEELPHGVSTALVLSEIEALTNPQPRAGKKEVSQEQKNLRGGSRRARSCATSRAKSAGALGHGTRLAPVDRGIHGGAAGPHQPESSV
jgi:hypothetical protein